MATYVYTCSGCGQVTESFRHLDVPLRHACGGDIKRDYRAENVGVAVVNLQRERERGGSGAVRDLFLPTAKELAGPGDPDGAKAIREWNDTHDPKPGNKRPMRPESPKVVF